MSILQDEIGIAMSGVKWDSGNFKLWQSTKDDIILFMPKQPTLAKSSNGRYQFGVTQFKQQTDETYKVTGGSAIFTITSAIQFDIEELKRLQEEWLIEGRAQHGDNIPERPRFIPLNVRKGQATVLINELSGTPDAAHNDKDIGTPGGTNSFLINLTELGAQEWVQGVKTSSIIPAGVKMTYEYLRMLPTVGAEVKVHGRRVFTHLSTSLNVSVGIGPFGGSLDIDAAWEKMVRDGDVEIKFVGTGLSPELEELRNELVTTFAEQAKEALFNSLFEPMPEVEEAEAGNARGRTWGANFAMKWKRIEEATDLNQTITFEGWTWLKASQDVELTSLISELDDSYVNLVDTQISAPVQIAIDSDELLETAYATFSASEGAIPMTTSFGPTGGSTQHIVTSQAINDVETEVTVDVNFVNSGWPIVQTKLSGLIKNGGNQYIIKPSAWVNRHWIYMFVKQGDQVKPPSENDYLICNVSYEGDHLPRTIKASSQITPLSPLRFNYPLSPEGMSGTAKFSAFGVVNGRLMRSTEQEINLDEEAVFILADDNGLHLVSQNSIFPESMSSDSLEKRLLRSSGRPVITSNLESSLIPNRTDGVNGSNGISSFRGTFMTYSLGTDDSLPSIYLRSASNQTKQIMLQDNDHQELFENMAISGKRRAIQAKYNQNNVGVEFQILLSSSS